MRLHSLFNTRKLPLHVALLMFAASFSIGTLSMTTENDVAAVSATDFKAGRIIDDSVFYNKDTMNVQQIQSFLDRLIPNCDIWGTGQSEYGGGTRAQYAASVGWPAPPYVCLNKYYENPTTGETSYEKGGGAFTGGQSSAQIIYNAAQRYGINPQVLLVLLKKESAGPLTSDTWPLKSQYKYAMGYACPDSGPGYSANCDSSKSGLYKQVDLAAWQLKYYKDHPNDYRYKIGWNDIQYSPDPSCGTKKVYIENMATLSLYIYTPYTPNDGALANYPGQAPCGAYGNRNFFMFFSEWFGSPSTPPATKCDSKVSGIACVWSVRKGDGSQFLTSSESELSTAMYSFGWINEGIIFHVSTSPKDGTIPVYRVRKDGRHYFSADAQEYASLKNTGGWTDEGIRFYAMPSASSANASHKVNRLYNSTNGNHYWVKDGAQKDYLLNTGYVTQVMPFHAFSGILPTPVPSSSRDNIYSLRNGNTYLYTTNLIEAESAISRLRYQYTGNLTTANAQSVGTPVYRLQGAGDFLYTTSVAERDSAVSRFGYINQGVRFYIDDSTRHIYRLIGTSASTHRYVSSEADLMALANKGWKYEKDLLSRSSPLAPVYRFINEHNGEHFYTLDTSEAAYISNRGWKYEGIAFDASPTTGKPVYRVYNGRNHFYTVDFAERTNAINNLGYRDEGTRFYVSESETSIPVYRLYGKGEHFYTTSSSERDAAVSKYGYRYEGERFYLTPAS